PLVPWPNPPAGTHLKVPRVGPHKKPAARRLEVSLEAKRVYAFDAQGRLIAHFPCSIAEKIEKRPRGSTRIKNAADNPNYTFDPEIFTELTLEERGTRKRLIPPGPNNPVGVAWIGLGISGYGLHGTPEPEDIGITGSKGCFRLANWNAKKLIDMVRIGIPVVIE
ncbi:MAG: L,D-transpeptidase, partial [Verrucomicrobiota bacterium]